MSIYFVDNINGNENNDGLSELTPVNSENCLDIIPGDTILFKRGNFYRRRLFNRRNRRKRTGTGSGRITERIAGCARYRQRQSRKP